jgi:hypothetical protein
MDKRLVELIGRAVKSEKSEFPLNAGWQFLNREYNIGLARGRRIRVSERDKAELVELVRRVAGVDVRGTALADLAGASRAEALRLARDEKWAGRKVAADRLALKALPGRPLRLNGASLNLPGRSHLDIAADAVETLEHDALLVVENYQCFDQLDRMRWALGGRHAEPLAVYRGDPGTSRADAVNGFIRTRALPVLALVDLDPAGLVIAQALPGIAGFVAPDFAVLEALLERGNPELYHRQRPAAERVLANSPSPAIRRLWDLLERRQAGLVQERWLQGDAELFVHPV